MPTVTASLFLNVETLQTGDASPFFKSLTQSADAGPWTRVSGPTAGALRLYLVKPSDNEIPTRVDAGSNTMHLYAKAKPDDADLALEIDFTKTADEDYFYYLAEEADFSVDTDLWDATGKLTLACDIVEKTTGGDMVNAWRANLTLLRGVSDGGSPSPQIYVKVTPQTLTGDQKAQARSNIGAGTGNGDLLDAGTITVGNAGKVAVVTAAKTLGAGLTYTDAATASTIVSRDASGNTAVGVLTATEIQTTGGITRGKLEDSGLTLRNSIGTVSFSVDSDSGFTRIYNLSGIGGLQEWEDGALGVVATMANDGTFTSVNLTANTAVISPTFKALSSGGATIKTENGSTVATWGVSNSQDIEFSGSVASEQFKAKDATGATIRTQDGTIIATFGVSNDNFVTFSSDIVIEQTLQVDGDFQGADGYFSGLVDCSVFRATDTAGATLKTANGTTAVTWGVSNSTTVTFAGQVVAATLSAASGSFTVGSNGDMTATHGKFQGSGGQAGHVQLKQGSTPNGSANETTLWGISGGIGWRDGTGTAYSLTLPTASSTLTTDERMMRMYRFAVGASAATISTSTSSWGSLITNGSSAVARLHSYFTVSTSASVASSRYTLWVESGATAVNPHALAGHPFYGLNYARGLEVSFPLLPAQFSGTTAVLPSDGYISGYFGQSRNTHYEDIVQVGFGFLLKGDGTIQLQALATNGGSVVKSSFVASGIDMSVNASAIASLIRVTSDTAGNLALYVDGSLKCTLAGGPTGLTNVSTSNFSVFAFTMSNGASTPTKATAITIGLPLFIL